MNFLNNGYRNYNLELQNYRNRIYDRIQKVVEVQKIF